MDQFGLNQSPSVFFDPLTPFSTMVEAFGVATAQSLPSGVFTTLAQSPDFPNSIISVEEYPFDLINSNYTPDGWSGGSDEEGNEPPSPGGGGGTNPTSDYEPPAPGGGGYDSPYGETTGDFESSGGEWSDGGDWGTPDPGLPENPDYTGVQPIILDLDDGFANVCSGLQGELKRMSFAQYRGNSYLNRLPRRSMLWEVRRCCFDQR